MTKQVIDTPMLLSLQEPTEVQLCEGCELRIDAIDVQHGSKAYCPRCGTLLYRGGTQSMSGNLAIALTCLLLFIPSHFFDFISIRLMGVMIHASIPAGIVALIGEGYYVLSLLVIFCSSIAPLLVCCSVISAHVALQYRLFTIFRFSMNLMHTLKHWVMIDVYLISIAISCFKLKDYSDIHIGVGLYGLLLLQLTTVLLMTRISVKQYWEQWQKNVKQHSKDNCDAQAHIHDQNTSLIYCEHCSLTQPYNTHCVRCKHQLHHRKPHSFQKTTAYLLAATISIFPANLLPISVLITNGQRLEDTIFSGVAAFVKSGMIGIAIIIFVASIVVPIIKIFGIAYLLIAIKLKRKVYHRQRMAIYFGVKWIGKWSVMDLFVISIMLCLLDRGQILDFAPGYGAIAFGAVVLFTMLAAESMDPRMIWDNFVETSHKNELEDEKINSTSNALQTRSEA